MIEELRKRIGPEVREQEPLAPHTTYKIGGPADYYFEASSSEDAARAVTAARQMSLPFYVLGGGSNVLVSDEGFRGLVILMANRGVMIQDGIVLAESGASVGMVSQKTVEAGLTGFEWAVGLPGTIGGAVRGNAGMWGSEMKDAVESVWAMKGVEERPVSREECGFGYRTSVFKREPGWLILKVAMRLAPATDAAASRQLMVKYLTQKKEKQPVEWPSAGCVFQNWMPSDDADLETLHHRFDLNTDEEIPRTPGGAIPAGWIIDRLGLKGYKVGHASVSEKHANFLVSDGQAQASDIIGLISAVKMKVRNSTDGMVQLAEEIEFVGF